MKTPYLQILARILVVLLFAGAAFDRASAAQPPERLQRADSFLGIHFDFHAGPDCTEIGKNTTREMIENIINLVQPDYLQIDCKGHRGLSSYPTRVGNQAPGFVGDPLRLWRQVTAERGVALYMHYSGVWDSEAIVRHPEWGCRQCRRQAERQSDVVLRSLRGPIAGPAIARTGRRLWRGRRVGGRRMLGLGAGLRRAGVEGIPRRHRNPGRAAQARRPALVRVPGIPPRSVPPLPAPLHRGGEEDASRFPDLQQLGLHGPHARAGLRPGGFPVRRLFAGGQRQLGPAVGPVLGAARQAVGLDGLELHSHHGPRRHEPKNGRPIAARSGRRTGFGRRFPSVLQAEAGRIDLRRADAGDGRGGQVLPRAAGHLPSCRIRAAGGPAVLDGRPTTAGPMACSRASCRGWPARCKPCWKASSRSKSWANTTWPAAWPNTR